MKVISSATRIFFDALLGLVVRRRFGALVDETNRSELSLFACSMVSLYLMFLIIMYIPLAEGTLQPFSCHKGEDRVFRMTSSSAADVVCSFEFDQR